MGAAGSTPNLKELDARLFTDTLTDGLGLTPERQQVSVVACCAHCRTPSRWLQRRSLRSAVTVGWALCSCSSKQ